MTVERTLERVEADLAEGELRRARDRLHGLRVTYPEQIELRLRLAEVYRAIGDPIQAGRWGYLRWPTTEVEQAERETFERWVGIRWTGRGFKPYHPFHQAEKLLRLPATMVEAGALDVLTELRAGQAAELRKGRTAGRVLLLVLAIVVVLLFVL